MTKPNNYYEGCVRDICHAVKSSDKNAVRQMADWYIRTGEIDEKCVLVPVPQHTGKADYTLEISELVARGLGCRVADILRSVPHEMLYSQKKKRSKNLHIGLYRGGSVDGKSRIFLIDNVISTGLTMRSCMRLVPGATPFAFAEVR